MPIAALDPPETGGVKAMRTGVVKIFDNGVKIAWNRQKREGAMCTCGRGNGHMCTLEYCKYD